MVRTDVLVTVVTAPGFASGGVAADVAAARTRATAAIAARRNPLPFALCCGALARGLVS
jgi:hypothetical protein